MRQRSAHQTQSRSTTGITRHTLSCVATWLQLVSEPIQCRYIYRSTFVVMKCVQWISLVVILLKINTAFMEFVLPCDRHIFHFVLLCDANSYMHGPGPLAACSYSILLNSKASLACNLHTFLAGNRCAAHFQLSAGTMHSCSSHAFRGTVLRLPYKQTHYYILTRESYYLVILPKQSASAGWLRHLLLLLYSLCMAFCLTSTF